MEPEGLAQAPEHQRIGEGRHPGSHRRHRRLLREIDEGLIDHHQIEITQLGHHLQHLRRLQQGAGGIAGIAEQGHPGTGAPHELHVFGRGEGEIATLGALIRVQFLATGRHHVAPTVEGGGGKGEGIANEELIDPTDQLRGAIAEHQGVGVIAEGAAQHLSDRAIGGRGTTKALFQPISQCPEQIRGREIRIDRCIEIPYVPCLTIDAAGEASQPWHRGRVVVISKIDRAESHNYPSGFTPRLRESLGNRGLNSR